VYTAILDHLLDPGTPRWSAVDLCNLPQASPTRDGLRRLARERGLFAVDEVQEACPVIALPSTFDEYLASIDGKQRHEIRRKLGRAEREAVTRWSLAGENLDAALDTFVALHAKSAPDKKEFMTDKMLGFFREISRSFHQMGWLQLATLEMDDRPAATMLNFDYGGDILVYNSGYDPQEHAWLSPGIVLLSQCIRYAIDEGRSRFDFMRGGEEYKYRFGAQKTTVHRLLISREPL
jgi:CelD/BcsL family acetyltransferase involved in cellulose biosynthesis